MNRSMKVIGGVLIVVVVIAAGALGYIYVSGGSANPSAPISAPALAAANSTQKVFRIDPGQSQVSFTLSEVLMGRQNTVVGKTNQVTGDIVVDLDHPANSKVGQIRVDVRSIATDSQMRDRMIRGQILQSSQDQFEFASFAPTSVTGLPDKITPGQPVKFQVAGNLTVRDITKPVTFDITATLSQDTPQRLDGSATTTVKRADFKLQIPNVPSVTDVSDDVALTIDFKAPLADSSPATQAAAQ